MSVLTSHVQKKLVCHRKSNALFFQKSRMSVQYIQLPKQVKLHRGPAGVPGGGSFAGTFERKEVVYLGSFLGPRGF